MRVLRSAGSEQTEGPKRSDRGPHGGPATHPLFGSWSATRWQYTSVADPERVVDVVCDLGGSVTLSLSVAAFILTCDVAGRGRWSLAGACVVNGDELQLTVAGAEEPDVVRTRAAGATLSLRSDASAWDFDGSGRDEAAAFVAVLVRL